MSKREMGERPTLCDRQMHSMEFSKLDFGAEKDILLSAPPFTTVLRIFSVEGRSGGRQILAGTFQYPLVRLAR
jgi:hypothetical protein